MPINPLDPSVMKFAFELSERIAKGADPDLGDALFLQGETWSKTHGLTKTQAIGAFVAATASVIVTASGGDRDDAMVLALAAAQAMQVYVRAGLASLAELDSMPIIGLRQ